MAESGFVIDGENYEIPTLDSLVADESLILYECCKLTIEDFAPDEDDGTMSEERQAEIAEKVKHPGFLIAMMRIAVQRGNPDWKEARVKSYVGRVNLMEVLEAFADADEEDDASPPEQSPETSEPLASSPRSSGDLSTSSGTDSSASSDEPVEDLVTTGIGGSDTSLG